MKILLSLLILTFAVTMYSSMPASAAKPADKGKPGGDSSVNLLGNDVSYPQCGRSLPTNHAFGIVGVNGGIATTANECLGSQLQWAHQATGKTAQAKAQLYVNTGNPWDDIVEYNVTTWPTDNIDQHFVNTYEHSDNRYKNPYGLCELTAGNHNGYTNSLACSWQYGWERAVDDVHTWFIPTAEEAGVNADPASYMWWLDVETMNSWQSVAPDAHQQNKATLEGMTAYLSGVIGAKIGIYSTHYQWGVIVGNSVDAQSNLYGLDSWLAGARNEKDAKSRCTKSGPLTGSGRVSMVQFISQNLDYNVSCI